MKFIDFVNMYDNWNGYITVNDDNLNSIVKGKTIDIMDNHNNLFEMEVVAFGFYDNELYVRVR